VLVVVVNVVVNVVNVVVNVVNVAHCFLLLLFFLGKR